MTLATSRVIKNYQGDVNTRIYCTVKCNVLILKGYVIQRNIKEMWTPAKRVSEYILRYMWYGRMEHMFLCNKKPLRAFYILHLRQNKEGARYSCLITTSPPLRTALRWFPPKMRAWPDSKPVVHSCQPDFPLAHSHSPSASRAGHIDHHNAWRSPLGSS